MKKNESKKVIHEAKKGGPPNKGSLQAYLQNFTKEAIDKLIYIMRNSKNESLKFAACKVFVDKTIADLSATEHSGEIATTTTLNVITYGQTDPLFTYLSEQLRSLQFKSASSNGFTRSESVSGSKLASQSSQDDIGDKPVN